MRAKPLQRSAETIAFADEYDMDLWRGYGAILNGYARVLAGETAQSISVMESGFRHLARTQTGTMVPTQPMRYTPTRWRGSGASRKLTARRRWCATSFDRARSRYFWPDCLRWLGDYLQLVPGDNRAEVEAAYAEGLNHARKQRAKSWELCAATNLARFWAEQGERRKAADLLAPLVSRFTEGFGTRALREASALLE